MRICRVLGIFVFLFPLLISCKKYPEGPGLSLRCKKARVEGEWKIRSYLIDWQDQAINPVIVNMPPCGDVIFSENRIIDARYTFDGKGNFKYYALYSNKTLASIDPITCVISYSESKTVYNDHGKWRFIQDKSAIELRYSSTTAPLMFNTDPPTVDIIRLTNNEMILESVRDSYIQITLDRVKG